MRRRTTICYISMAVLVTTGLLFGQNGSGRGRRSGGGNASVTSPDDNTLLVLTSRYNLVEYTSGSNAGNNIPSDSNEYVFVYNIANKVPIKTQVIQVPNSYQGIVFDPSGKTFYVSGGVDDPVHIYDLGAGGWAERSGSPISLGHNNKACATLGCGNGVVARYRKEQQKPAAIHAQ